MNGNRVAHTASRKGRNQQSSRQLRKHGVQSKSANRNGAKGQVAASPRRNSADAAVTRPMQDASRLSAKIEPSRRLRLFLESSFFDFVMVLVVSVALTFTVSYAFNSAAGYRGNVLLLTVIDASLLVALFAGAWSKKALLPSSIATLVIAAGVVGIAAVNTPPDVPLITTSQKVMGIVLAAPTVVVNDVDQNYIVFALVAVVVPILVYLLSRRRAGLVVLLIVSIVAIGTVQFLYRDWMSTQPWLPAFVCSLLGVAMLFVYQSYRQSVYSAKRLKSTSFLGAFAFSTLVGAVCVLIGLGVFYGVVNTMGIQTPETKFFQNYVAAPVDENAGQYQHAQVTGDDTTDDTTDNEEQTGKNTEGEGSQAEGPLAQIASAMQTVSYAFSQEARDEQNSEINYALIRAAVYLVGLLIVALIVGIILARRAMRERRLRKIEGQPASYRMWYLYSFFLTRFKRMKIRKPEHLTPYEYALGFRKPMQQFTKDTDGVDFVQVTTAYMNACYGDGSVSDEEYERVKKYYRAFFKNARRYVGWPKWVLWKFWRI